MQLRLLALTFLVAGALVTAANVKSSSGVANWRVATTTVAIQLLTLEPIRRALPGASRRALAAAIELSPEEISLTRLQRLSRLAEGEEEISALVSAAIAAAVKLNHAGRHAEARRAALTAYRLRPTSSSRRALLGTLLQGPENVYALSATDTAWEVRTLGLAENLKAALTEAREVYARELQLEAVGMRIFFDQVGLAPLLACHGRLTAGSTAEISGACEQPISGPAGDRARAISRQIGEHQRSAVVSEGSERFASSRALDAQSRLDNLDRTRKEIEREIDGVLPSAIERFVEQMVPKCKPHEASLDCLIREGLCLKFARACTMGSAADEVVRSVRVYDTLVERKAQVLAQVVATQAERDAARAEAAAAGARAATARLQQRVAAASGANEIARDVFEQLLPPERRETAAMTRLLEVWRRG